MTEAELQPAEPAPIARQPLRVSDPAKALSLIRRQVKQLERRMPVYQAVEAAYDREPTDSKEALQLSGLGWTCTIDWGGMKAGVDAGALTDYNLATQPETYVKLMARRDGPGSKERLEKIERADKECLDSWKGWIPQLEMMTHNRRAHGLGIFHFPHPVGWHFRSLHPSCLIFPPNAKIDIDEWDWYALRTEFRIVDLLARLEDSEASERVGWQLGNVRKVISKLKDGATFLSGMMRDPEAYSVDLKSSDLWFAEAQNAGVVAGFQFYVREWNGRVSEHFLVDDEEIGFLFSGVNRHGDMSETISLFPLAMGQGYMERVRGYGVEMLPFHDTENRARNHLLDQFLVSGVVIKSMGNDDTSQALTEMKHAGPFLFMTGDLEISAQQMPNVSTEGMKILAEMERAGSLRNRYLGGMDQTQRLPEMSATQSRILYQSENSAESNEVARFYEQLGKFHHIRLRRMLQPEVGETTPGGLAAMEMVDDLLAAGVLPEDFKNIKRVTARTIFGDGNPVNQFLAMADLTPWYGSFTAEGKRAFVHHLTVARLRDPDLARVLTGYDGRVDEVGLRNRWNAQVENNTFETSDTRQDMGPDDDHLIHAEIHTVFAEEAVQRVGVDIEMAEAFARVKRCEAHMAGHLESLSMDQHLQEPFKVFRQRWAELTNWARQTEQKLSAEQKRKQAEELENLRNPRPSVKDAEVMETERLRRQIMMEEAAMRKEFEQQRHEVDLKMALEKRAAGIPLPPAATPSRYDPYGRPVS